MAITGCSPDNSPYNCYLRDVVPAEIFIRASSRNNKPASALEAQAIAARTFTYHRTWGITNSNDYQVFVPFYYDTLSTDQQDRGQSVQPKLPKLDALAQTNHHAAGLDIGDAETYAAVPASAADPAVRVFRIFTTDLEARAKQLLDLAAAFTPNRKAGQRAAALPGHSIITSESEMGCGGAIRRRSR